MKINNKLKKIAELVPSNSFLLDVGCDHALLDIYLIDKNVKSIASDINDLPLSKAYENIKKYNCLNQITLVKGDGLEYLNDEISVIVISGMGGILIKNIIKKDLSKIKNQKIITCPNNDSDILRKFMMENNFKIESELLVKDKYIYEIICFVKGNEKLTTKEINYGKYFKRDNLYYEYFNKKKDTLMTIKNNLPKKYLFKRLKLTKKIRDIESII